MIPLDPLAPVCCHCPLPYDDDRPPSPITATLSPVLPFRIDGMSGLTTLIPAIFCRSPLGTSVPMAQGYPSSPSDSESLHLPAVPRVSGLVPPAIASCWCDSSVSQFSLSVLAILKCDGNLIGFAAVYSKLCSYLRRRYSQNQLNLLPMASLRQSPLLFTTQ
jgi:hypothetical protein